MLCDACKLGFHQTATHPNCANCGSPKPNQEAKLCEDCSFDLDQCEVCRGPLPEPEDDDSRELEPTDEELDEIEFENSKSETDEDLEGDVPPDDCGDS